MYNSKSVRSFAQSKCAALVVEFEA